MTDLSWPADRPYYSVKGITQTSLALILNFNLCTDEERPVLAEKLVQLIRDFGNRMSTGFLGTPNILQALSNNGYTDVAYTLLLQEKNPSWLFSVNQGATTMWEHWDGIRENGTFWSKDMNSYNHYAYGAIGEWMMRALAGIDMLEPGYQKLLLHPRPIEELSFVSAWQNTPYGQVRCEWRVNGNEHTVRCTVPAGATAVLVLDDALLSELKLGGRKPSADMGVMRMSQSDRDVVLELGSGKYVFTWKHVEE
jgi:alpha-L-rhamnosidase